MALAFSGAPVIPAEPLVGEILALRTFRVDDTGLLLPLYSQGCWYDGTNSARCTPPTGDWQHSPHPAPAEDCECGLYAYGTRTAANRNRSTRHVQAVVACWGAVIAGSQGIRAEHARIDALWLAPQAPRWLRQRVAVRYPSAHQFADLDAMLAEFPLTELRCYEPAPRRNPVTSAALLVAALLVTVLGLVPTTALHHSAALSATLVAVTLAGAVATSWCAVGTRAVGHLSAAAVGAAVLAWLVAPWLGPLGWLLRLPLLQAALVSAGRYLLALRPAYFPIVPASERRTFRGVNY